MRDFGDTFAELGLKQSYTGTAYGLAEHVVGVLAYTANDDDRPLSELTDDDLECVGTHSDLSEGCQVMNAQLKPYREQPPRERLQGKTMKSRKKSNQ